MKYILYTFLTLSSLNCHADSIFTAASEGDYAIFYDMFSKGDEKKVNTEGMTAFQVACLNSEPMNEEGGFAQYVHIMKFLVLNGADINKKYPNGTTCLIEMTKKTEPNRFSHFDIKIFEILLLSDADLTVKTRKGQSAADIFSNKIKKWPKPSTEGLNPRRKANTTITSNNMLYIQKLLTSR